MKIKPHYIVIILLLSVFFLNHLLWNLHCLHEQLKLIRTHLKLSQCHPTSMFQPFPYEFIKTKKSKKETGRDNEECSDFFSIEIRSYSGITNHICWFNEIEDSKMVGKKMDNMNLYNVIPWCFTLFKFMNHVIVVIAASGSLHKHGRHTIICLGHSSKFVDWNF